MLAHPKQGRACTQCAQYTIAYQLQNLEDKRFFAQGGEPKNELYSPVS